MKRPRPRSPCSTDRTRLRQRLLTSPTTQSNRPFLTSVLDATQALPVNTEPHSFFDKLPDDALILIIQRLARLPSPVSPRHCPLLNLAAVSVHLRHLISTQIGNHLSFSVYGHPDWFWLWLSAASSNMRHLVIHNRSYRSAGNVIHQWPMWPRRPHIHLQSAKVLPALTHLSAPLHHLDISGLTNFRRTTISTLAQLLTSINNSLQSLRIDISHFRIVHAITQAKLQSLTRLSLVTMSAASEYQLLDILRSLKPNTLHELTMDACESMPSLFLSHPEIRQLLSQLQLIHIDYDDDIHADTLIYAKTLESVTSAVTLPSLERVVLSGTGIPLTYALVTRMTKECPKLSEVRVVDCDVSHNPHIADTEKTIVALRNVLTQYHPRWLTYNIAQAESLRFCTKLSRLRVFTAPGSETCLLQLGGALRTSLRDLEIYPKTHESKQELAPYIVHLVCSLENLRRLCLVTLDLSIDQLKGVLTHCGAQLRCFTFSPQSDICEDGNCSAFELSELLSHTARNSSGLRRLQCIFPNDLPPVVSCSKAKDLLIASIDVLERRIPHLEASSIRSLVRKMLGERTTLEQVY